MFGMNGTNLGTNGSNCGGDGSSVKGSDGLNYQRLGGTHPTISQG